MFTVEDCLDSRPTRSLVLSLLEIGHLEPLSQVVCGGEVVVAVITREGGRGTHPVLLVDEEEDPDEEECQEDGQDDRGDQPLGTRVQARFGGFQVGCTEQVSAMYHQSPNLCSRSALILSECPSRRTAWS